VSLPGRRLYLGFDASGVTAATLAEGLGGRRVRGFARAPLAPGALVPSASGPSVERAEDVRAAVRRAVEGCDPGPVTLVLPDGLARIALLDRPAGADPRDYARFRLTPSLPFAPSEAVIEALSAGRDRLVGAAVRRSTVAAFEHAAQAAGLEARRVHLAPLVALEGLLRGGAGDAVHLVLGDVALCLAVVRDGALVALRSRRRDRSPGEASRLRDEVARVAAGTNGGSALPLALAGSDGRRLRRELGAPELGEALPAPGEWAEAADAAWLGGLLA
jgi:hypothetical protein